MSDRGDDFISDVAGVVEYLSPGESMTFPAETLRRFFNPPDLDLILEQIRTRLTGHWTIKLLPDGHVLFVRHA